MKIKKNYISSITKDIKKGFKRIYWFIFCKYKYFYLSSHLNGNKEINQHYISILLPSRERSIKFKRMLNSIIQTCKNLNRIELLILLDNDDKEINEYKKIISEKKYKSLNIFVFIKSLSSHSKRNNYLAEKSKGQIIFPFNDDVVFKSFYWDDEIDKEFSKVKNMPFCLWVDSGQKYNYLHSDFPIINRNWYEKLGYVGSEFFHFWYLDTWICDLSKKSKRFFVSKNIKLFQYSANTIKEEVDSTHLRNIKDDIPNKDRVIWLNTEKNRLNDSKLLI